MSGKHSYSNVTNWHHDCNLGIQPSQIQVGAIRLGDCRRTVRCFTGIFVSFPWYSHVLPSLPDFQRHHTLFLTRHSKPCNGDLLCSLFLDFHFTQIRQTASFLFPLSLHWSSDLLTMWISCTIWISMFLVRYNHVSLTVDDINLRATATTSLSTRGVTIPIYLVISATDSLWQCAVVFNMYQ